MIQKGEYSKEQLFSILDIQDLSNAKRKLDSQGIIYTTNNKRGNNYRLIVTNVPVSVAAIENFRKCCSDEFNIDRNIDYEKFALLICFLQYDKGFINLPLEYMENRIKDCGLVLSRQTIAKYLKILEKNNCLYISLNDYIYYIPMDNEIKYLTRNEWIEFWDSFYSYPDSRQLLIEDIGGHPQKREKIDVGNALVPAYEKLVSYAKIIVKEMVI